MMSWLAEKVPTQFGLLFAAGIVMVITLWTSRKARGVTDTELSLTKETSGQEDYQPGLLSRTLVRIAIQTYKIYEQIVPTHIVQGINRRFAQSNEQYATYHDKPAFDMIRAAVNLTVASVLIAMATSMKLPLSTTYVTFMVAMGTALADGVWWRESAVYRVTGVLTVISGWFLTALSAFVLTALAAAFIWYGGKIAIGALLMLTVVFLYRTHVHHKKKTSERKHQQALYHDDHGDDLGIILRKHTLSILPRVQSLNYDVIHNLITNKDMVLKKLAKEVEQLALETKVLKSGIYNTFVSLPHEALFHGEKYVQAIDYLRKCATALESMAVQARDYALNQHPDLIAAQQQELHDLQEQLHDILEQVRDAFSHDSFAQKITLLEQRLDDAVKYVDSFKLNQLQRIKSNELGVRNTMLYFTVLGELRNILLYLGKLLHLAHKLQKK